jgi:hypothetical protein
MFFGYPAERPLRCRVPDSIHARPKSNSIRYRAFRSANLDENLGNLLCRLDFPYGLYWDQFRIMRYTASTCTTPGTALMAPAICGDTL